MAPLYVNNIVSYKEETIMKNISTINVQNVNVNNSVAHLNALTKQREELVKKLAAIDAEIKETRKTIEVKQAVLKLQKEYADKAAVLKKEYEAKIKALVGDDNALDPTPAPESPKSAPKVPAKETAAPKAAPVAKKAEEKKSTEAPKTAAPAPKKEEKVAKTTATPSEKKEAVKAHNKSQFLHEITVDNFQKVINGIPKEEAAEAILHAKINGTKEQFATFGNAVIYGYQNGIRKFWFTYSAPELLNTVSEEMGEILEAGERYGFTVKVTQRAATPKTQATQNVTAPAASSAKADHAQAIAPKASQKQETPADNPDAFRPWTLSNAIVVDGSDEI